MLNIQSHIPMLTTPSGSPEPGSSFSPAANHLRNSSNSTASLPTIAHQPTTSASQSSGASAYLTLRPADVIAVAMGMSTADAQAYLQNFKFLPEGSGYHTGTDFAHFVQTYGFEPPWASTNTLPGSIKPAQKAENAAGGKIPNVGPKTEKLINLAEKGEISAPELIRQTMGTHIDLANHYLDQFDFSADPKHSANTLATNLAAHLAVHGKEPSWAADYKINLSVPKNSRDLICLIYECTLSDVEQFLLNFELPAEHYAHTSGQLIDHIVLHKTVPEWAFLYKTSSLATDFLSARIPKTIEMIRAELIGAAERFEMNTRQYAT